MIYAWVDDRFPRGSLAYWTAAFLFGALLTGTVMTILGAIAAANFGIIPHTAPAYDFVFDYVVPVLIPLYLFNADLRRIFLETTRTTLAFLLASVGTVSGAVAAVWLLDFSVLDGGTVDGLSREPAIAGQFVSTYIGGSVNYAALGDITGLRHDASFFSAATATDNLFSALYLAMLALLPAWRWFACRFPSRDHPLPGGLPGPGSLGGRIGRCPDRLARPARLALRAGHRAVPFARDPISRAMARLHGGFELAMLLSFVFFAAIAAGADVVAMIEIAPLLILLVAILLTVHMIITFGLGRLFGLSLPELITASNAAVLGATTAPVLAAAKGWRELVMPGVLVGVFGYALGTLAGTGVYEFWKWVIG